MPRVEFTTTGKAHTLPHKEFVVGYEAYLATDTRFIFAQYVKMLPENCVGLGCAQICSFRQAQSVLMSSAARGLKQMVWRCFEKPLSTLWIVNRVATRGSDQAVQI